MKPTVNSKGYSRVDLSINGSRKTCLVHRLVAEAYLPNPENKPHINHKNEMPSHNYLNNLEWATPLENNLYGNHLNNIRKKVYCIELDKTYESMLEAS